jgi:hypothetical protein
MYDHRPEVQWHRNFAAALRAEAASHREHAEKKARELEAQADREDSKASNIHRLCTAGGDAKCCGVSPEETT